MKCTTKLPDPISMECPEYHGGIKSIEFPFDAILIIEKRYLFGLIKIKKEYPAEVAIKKGLIENRTIQFKDQTQIKFINQ